MRYTLLKKFRKKIQVGRNLEQSYKASQTTAARSQNDYINT